MLCIKNSIAATFFFKRIVREETDKDRILENLQRLTCPENPSLHIPEDLFSGLPISALKNLNEFFVIKQAPDMSAKGLVCVIGHCIITSSKLLLLSPRNSSTTGSNKW
jgi:hypothetical protein